MPTTSLVAFEQSQGCLRATTEPPSLCDPVTQESRKAGAISVLISKQAVDASGKVSVRVLLVDDFEPFRRVIASILGKQLGFQIVAEALDGEEAVQKAQELKPDLVVLDIGLPKLNGIEAARQIRSASPTSRILFFSGNDYPEIVRDALDTGADGYVSKQDAHTDLLEAVEAVLLGKQYVSKRLTGHGSSGAV
jgi:DNA-binding NarL/FixJ family response regulator